MSGPNNPTACTTLCHPATGTCAQSPEYDKSADFDYWIPLAFDDETGAVLPFEPFVDEFNITL